MASGQGIEPFGLLVGARVRGMLRVRVRGKDRDVGLYAHEVLLMVHIELLG